jgi:hypothetical protein
MDGLVGEYFSPDRIQAKVSDKQGREAHATPRPGVRYSCNSHPSGIIGGKAARGGEGFAMDVAAMERRAPLGAVVRRMQY